MVGFPRPTNNSFTPTLCVCVLVTSDSIWPWQNLKELPSLEVSMRTSLWSLSHSRDSWKLPQCRMLGENASCLTPVCSCEKCWGQGPQLLFTEIDRHRDWLLQSYKPYVPCGERALCCLCLFFDAVLWWLWLKIPNTLEYIVSKEYIVKCYK